MEQPEFSKLEDCLQYEFKDKGLLHEALCHSSFVNEQPEADLRDNERLEFLGDAVIKLVISEYLYNKFPEKAEGDLTKIRAAVISDRTLAAVSRKLRLGSYLLLGTNEKKTGGVSRKSNLANAFEALTGAIYLDSGLGKARDFLVENIASEIEKVSKAGYIRDYKSALQEYVQQRKWGLPQYRVIRETGPKHKKIFWIEVKIKGKKWGEGKGLNKKEAEQRAAFEALRNLKSTEDKSGPPKRGNFKKSFDRRPTRPLRPPRREEPKATPKPEVKKGKGIKNIISKVRRRFSR